MNGKLEEFLSLQSFDEYMEKHEKAETSRRNFMVLYRALQRFEAIQATEEQCFELTLDGLDEDVLRDFDSFLRNEHTLYDEYPNVYERFRYNSDHRKNPRPQPRGDNAITNQQRCYCYAWRTCAYPDCKLGYTKA